MSEFGAHEHGREMDSTRAAARLPGVEMEIVHRRAPDGEAEQISIHLQAVPSFDAFGRALGADPFAFWAEAVRLAWLPWFTAANAALLPWTLGSRLLAPSKLAGKKHSGA